MTAKRIPWFFAMVAGASVLVLCFLLLAPMLGVGALT
jgi:hypothetical protein